MELQYDIALRQNIESVLNLCDTFPYSEICHDENFWKTIVSRHFPNLYLSFMESWPMGYWKSVAVRVAPYDNLEPYDQYILALTTSDRDMINYLS